MIYSYSVRFLLAKLHLYSLEDKINPRQLAFALESLPRGSDAYNQVYEEAMERIQSQSPGLRDLSFRVIAWIVHAQRPLTKSEMQHALATTNDASSLDHGNITEIGLLASVCAGLVTVDAESNIVRLVHHTAMEYFDRTRAKWFLNAQDEITQTCVTYLSFQDFDTGVSPTPDEYRARVQKNALYEYAATYWGYHARNSYVEDGKLVLEFLESASKVSASAQAMCYSEIGYYDDFRMNGTHLAAYFGLASSMSNLIQRQHDVNCKDSFGSAPLLYAVRKGHEAVVRILLYHNADVRTRDKSGLTPLISASEKGFEATLRLIMGKNADIEIKDRGSRRASLSWAAKHGNEPMVRLLLDKTGKRVNSRDITGHTALTLACRHGYFGVVKQLVDKGADIEVIDEFNRTPLSWAALNGHVSVVELLLVRNATVDRADMLNHTALLWAMETREREIVKLLLQKSTSPHDQASTGQTLIWAAKEQDIELVQLLLEKMAPINAQDMIGRTPLSWAASIGSVDIVKLLLGNHVIIDLPDMNHRTPLSWAADEGHEAVIKLLLDSNPAGINRTDKNGQTALSWAATRGHVGVVQLLIDKKADVDHGDYSGRTPLLRAAGQGHEAVVRLLLQEGAEVDWSDYMNKTALSLAAENGCVNSEGAA